MRLANATFIPYDVVKYATDLDMHFDNVEKQVKNFNPEFEGFNKSKSTLSKLKLTAENVTKRIENHVNNKKMSKKSVKKINTKLQELEKSFLLPEGMPYGDWYKSIYTSPDPFSGYAS